MIEDIILECSARVAALWWPTAKVPRLVMALRKELKEFRTSGIINFSNRPEQQDLLLTHARAGRVMTRAIGDGSFIVALPVAVADEVREAVSITNFRVSECYTDYLLDLGRGFPLAWQDERILGLHDLTPEDRLIWRGKWGTDEGTKRLSALSELITPAIESQLIESGNTWAGGIRYRLTPAGLIHARARNDSGQINLPPHVLPTPHPSLRDRWVKLAEHALKEYAIGRPIHLNEKT